MTDATPVHPLRQRLIDDMTLRGLNAASQRTYIRAVRACCAHMGVRPGALTADEVRAFLLHLQKNGLSVAAINSHASALRFFLRVTLRRSADVDLCRSSKSAASFLLSSPPKRSRASSPQRPASSIARRSA
jgi:site-specific recombinase XerC